MSIYIDSYGQEHKPSAESKCRSRSGVFTIMLSQGHVLISWPNRRPDVPELPGGGIEKGEDVEQALIREIIEEADIEFETLKPEKTHHQTIKYYADSDDEYWDYEQTYWLIKGEDIDKQFFQGERQPCDALKSKWIPVNDIEKINLHAVHAKALKELLK